MLVSINVGLGKSVFVQEVANQIHESIHLRAASDGRARSAIFPAGSGALPIRLGTSRLPEVFHGHAKTLVESCGPAHSLARPRRVSCWLNTRVALLNNEAVSFDTRFEARSK